MPPSQPPPTSTPPPLSPCPSPTSTIQTLHTPRLALHPLTPSLLPAFHRVWSDPTATQWSRRGASTPADDPEASRGWVEGVLPVSGTGAVDGDGAGARADRRGWVVIEGNGDPGTGDRAGWGTGGGAAGGEGEGEGEILERVAGVVTFLPLRREPGHGEEDAELWWELGFLFRGAFWGRGYATESCRVAIEALRGEVEERWNGKGNERRAGLVANVAPGNTASLGVCEKLGFGETGRRVGGEEKVFLGGAVEVG